MHFYSLSAIVLSFSHPISINQTHQGPEHLAFGGTFVRFGPSPLSRIGRAKGSRLPSQYTWTSSAFPRLQMSRDTATNRSICRNREFSIHSQRVIGQHLRLCCIARPLNNLAKCNEPKGQITARWCAYSNPDSGRIDRLASSQCSLVAIPRSQWLLSAILACC